MVRAIAEVPIVSDGDPDDPTWYPLQRVPGIDTFGVNLFVANRAGQTLVDERASGQQELYLVLEGEAIFELDEEEVRLDRGTVLAVTEAAVGNVA